MPNEKDLQSELELEQARQAQLIEHIAELQARIEQSTKKLAEHREAAKVIQERAAALITINR